MYKKFILLTLSACITSTAFAGAAISLTIPEALVPTTDSEVRNPVTLEATAFSALEQASGEITYAGQQWYVGEWDNFVDQSQKSIDLPFTFSLNGNDYTKIVVNQLGYIALLPADHDGSYVRLQDSLRTDGWTNVNSSFFQGNQYPTVFALAKNNAYNDNWSFDVGNNDNIVNNQLMASYISHSEDSVLIYNQAELVRDYGHAVDTPAETYTLEQAIVLHANGDIELHFDTNAPIAAMVEDLLAGETESGRLSERFYSGVVIPEALTDGTALPFVNYIVAGGAQSYLFSASKVNALTADDLPGDGTPVTAAAPEIQAEATIANLTRPYSYFTESESNTHTLTETLSENTSMNWATREVLTFTYESMDGPISSSTYSDWSEINQFKVVAAEKSDSSDLLGSLPVTLLSFLSILLIFRKRK